MANTGYEAKILEASKELTGKEKISLKDTTNAVALDEATKESRIVIAPAYYAVIGIHNEMSKDQKDYEKYVIVDKEGNKYVTGSKSFWNSFIDIFRDMQGEEEDYEVEIYRVPSKNYKGKDFITCSIR